ncbi:DUF4115 domain-containing protein [Weissella minor]|uniref:helix-turn-helix domain-containing protein n=1 Tax=Weissella minor TaxID=1620 RepID=UPI001BB01E30|nr:helix-turn-helix domain-containing protein [Weissella minor]MBS0949783.1 DUF4115 domain-containing protein [Weissella minor]
MSEEQNQEIGQTLQDARIEKGWSLDDIQQMTKIQKRYLQAIENGQFDQLPGKFYERAFVRQYAGAVGLDADEIVKNFDTGAPEQPVVDTADLEAARVDSDNITRTGMHRETETPVEKTRQVMPKVLIAVAAVVAIGIIWALVSAVSGTSKSESNNSSVAVSSSKVESSESSSEASSSESSEKASSKSSSSEKKSSDVSLGEGTVSGQSVSYDKVKLPNKTETMKLSTTSDAWLQVTDNNGTALYQGTVSQVNPVDVQIPESATSIHLQIGDATPLKVELGGKNVPLKNNGATVWNAYMQFQR